MYNLERFISVKSQVTGKNISIKQETHIWSKPYQLCKGIKTRFESQVWPYGTFFKIVKN